MILELNNWSFEKCGNNTVENLLIDQIPIELTFSKAEEFCCKKNLSITVLEPNQHNLQFLDPYIGKNYFWGFKKIEILEIFTFVFF